MAFELNGDPVAVPDDGSTLLEVLRGPLALHSPKDGCSPQGQCGCCTVLVDDSPRVSCVTPVRRVAGRVVRTLEGLEPEVSAAWADAFLACGASQCGFCTPGIVMRLESLRSGPPRRDGAVERALGAHLCRCTGWQTITEAFATFGSGTDGGIGRDLDAAGRRATLELGAPQRVGPEVVLGSAGFSADTAPEGCLVAVPDPAGGWIVDESVALARRRAGKVQGRRTTLTPTPPLEVPAGDWDLTLRTSWVDAAYVETDASWCEPGGEPSPAAANGGAFGAKRHSPLPAAARALADEHGRPVLALWSREDCCRFGPKRPPVAAGINADGTGVIHVVRTEGIAERIRAVAPGLEVVELDVVGPPTSSALRAAGWAEAVVLVAGVGASSDAVRVEPATVAAPERVVVRTSDGAVAWASCGEDRIALRVDGGAALDAITLRSYCIGAAHMGLSWITSEGVATDADGAVLDLTVRSLGVLKAADFPLVEVELVASDAPAVRVSDAAFAAVAAATWRRLGCSPVLPV